MTTPRTTRQSRRRAERQAFRIGLVASALIHILIALLNPGPAPDATGYGAAAPAQPERGQLIDLAITDSPDEEQPVAPQPVAVPRPVTALGAAAVSVGGEWVRGRAAVVPNIAAAAPALRYRAAPLWAPPPPRVETCAQRVRREITERIASGIADPTVGVVPPPATAEKPRFEAGIRIPFGRKPPGPAQVVAPPPLPDSIRSVLAPRPDTANPRLIAADSLRCAGQDGLEPQPRPRPDTLPHDWPGRM